MLKKILLVAVAFTVMGPLIITGENGDSPVISDLKVQPQVSPVGATYTITLRITDPQGPDDIIKTLHQVREGAESIEVSINDDGMKGDASKGDGIYTGRDMVPRTAGRRTHRFEVFVRDKAGHKSNVLEYRFTVLEGIET